MAKALKQIGRSLTEAWQSVSDGWRELVNRCSSALTRFVPQRNAGKPGNTSVPGFPQWGFSSER